MQILKLCKKFFTIANCLCFCSLSIIAQNISGYVNGMPSVIVQKPYSDTWWQALAHNRLNLGWQMSDYLRFDAGMRNRLITGSEALINPKSAGADLGLLDLSWNWASGKNILLNTTFDRLNFTYEKDKWKLQLGRQRINWGQTFVWNPNDIFNTYSFFDFDYPERQGCDAFRIKYYHTETSSSELAISANHDKKITAAALHRWNKRGVDYQIMAGEQAETDLVIGGALTSDFSGLNLQIEISYLNLADTSGIVAVSVGADYFFQLDDASD